MLTVTKDGRFVVSTRRSGSLYILQRNTVTSVAAGCSARRSARGVNKPPSRYAESAFTHALSVVEESCDAGVPSSSSKAVLSQKFTVEPPHTTKSEYRVIAKGIKKIDIMIKPHPLTKFKNVLT